MIDGDYYLAMTVYLEAIDELYRTGKVSVQKTAGDYIFMGVLIGIISAIVGGSKRSKKVKKMKQVELATNAANYVVENSFNLREREVMFLYENVVRSYVPRSSSSGGGSHYSGGYHSSGGGHFSGGGRHF